MQLWQSVAQLNAILKKAEQMLEHRKVTEPMPKLSVIVPVYNTEKYLRECVDSILAQTFTDFELILVFLPNINLYSSTAHIFYITF